jgi:hypothetical protein
MSHFSRLKTTFRDRELLVRCLEEMGYEVRTGGTVQGYTGQQEVDFSVQAGNGYGIGFVQNQGGSYDLVADWWGVKGKNGDRLVAQLQERINRIQREYALRMVMEQTKKDGFEVVEQATETDGSVRIVVRRWV